MMHGMAGEGMPFKKMRKQIEGEAPKGKGRRSTKERQQGLSLAGRKGASRRKGY